MIPRLVTIAWLLAARPFGSHVTAIAGCDISCLSHVTSGRDSVTFVGNQIGTLTATTLFGDHESIHFRSIDITNNGITEIVPEAFKSTPNLVSLTLATNAWIKNSTKYDVFTGLRNLRHLDLRSTFSEDLDNTTSSDVIKQLFFSNDATSWLSGLESLDLADNRLVDFPIESALTMSGLRRLRLSGNSLETFEFRASAMSNCSLVLVDRNAISWLSLESIANLIEMNTSYQLQTVNISGNPLECSCRNRWFVQWVRRSLNASTGSSRVLADVESLECADPPHLAGRPIHTVKFIDIDSQLCRPRAAPYGLPHIAGGIVIGLLVFGCVVRTLIRDRKVMKRKRSRNNDVIIVGDRIGGRSSGVWPRLVDQLMRW